MAKESSKGGGGMKPDLASILGLVVALVSICGGLVLEGGQMTDVIQITAAMIVVGGTVGAVMVTTPMGTLLRAAKALVSVFLERPHNPEQMIEELIALATKARKSSIVSLESDIEKIQDPFLKKALTLAVDGTDLQEIRKMMELDMMLSDQLAESEAKVYEAAGGYAPTIGIIGAVLGLIQVMKHLENIEEVGHGIAVAFVATVYGVGTANILFLPAGNKIKARAHHQLQLREMILEGVCSIVEGMNPKLIRVKLEAFCAGHGSGKTGKKKNEGAQPVAQAASAN
jgi:chemotaxis protein MotA